VAQTAVGAVAAGENDSAVADENAEAVSSGQGDDFPVSQGFHENRLAAALILALPQLTVFSGTPRVNVSVYKSHKQI